MKKTTRQEKEALWAEAKAKRAQDDLFTKVLTCRLRAVGLHPVSTGDDPPSGDKVTLWAEDLSQFLDSLDKKR